MAVPDADLSGTTTLPRTYIDFDDFESLGPVIKQDREMVARLQRATHSDGFRGGVFSEQEVRIRHFHDQYYRLMGRRHP
jgi:phenylpropionate dioxygenase-like ring-hydroxylating dioxygenase large terminal subunit